MNKPHKHAALMLQYAQDAAETDKPWERWEVRLKSENYWGSLTINPSWYDDWGSLAIHPSWSDDCEYRRKPRTININGIEVPEPMREIPTLLSVYFFPRIQWGNKDVFDTRWSGDYIDRSRFNAGLCHSTREAAELHAKALLSFTKKEEAE